MKATAVTFAAGVAAFLATAIPSTAATVVYEAPQGCEGGMEPRREVAVTNIPSAWPTRPDRLWLELRCEDSGEDPVEIAVYGGRGRDGGKKGVFRRLADLPEKGRRGLSIATGGIKGAIDFGAVTNVTLRTADGEERRFGLSRMLLLDEGEEPPEIDEAPRPRVRDAAEHHADYLRFRDGCRMGAFVVGQATSMENVRPRAGFRWRDAGEVKVRLARGERESVQLLVAPAVHDLRDVAVGVVMEGGPNADFASSNIEASVVGYVETRDPPPYKIRPGFVIPPRGWWPDPILGFQKSCDIAGEDVQAFWIRVTCPEDQPAGEYEGRLTVSAANATSVTTRFTVRVNDFSVGSGAPLPLAVSCIYPGCNAGSLDGRKDLAERIRTNEYHTAWRTREERYCDFFADYYVTMDSLYVNRNREPRWEMLVRLRDQGRLGMFNLCYWWYMGLGEDAYEKWRTNTLPLLRGRYEKAKELGIADHAYLYGCDELGRNVFTNIARTVDALHREFPGVPVMTTARDGKLGTGDSPLKNVDIFCPATCFWHGRPVRRAQAEGRQVWWYFCNNPADPYANTTLEGPPIEIRSLMGAQTQKFKPDGFLYYATLNWNSERPILKGPFTDWNPRSYGLYHGDGQWTCCGGPDLLPLPTIRLENFRDGLEDLWYAKRLEEALRKVEGDVASAPPTTHGGAAPSPRHDWLRRARAALAVPGEVARSVSAFSTDPDVLYRWRDEMADLVEEAGVDALP